MKKTIALLFLAFWLPNSLLSAADLSVTSSGVIASAKAKRITGTAGTVIAAGDLIFRHPDDNRFYKAIGTDDSPEHFVIGIALNGAAIGQPLFVCTDDPELTIGATISNGAILCLSATVAGGKICPLADMTAGNWVSVIGVGIAINKINFHIVRSDVEMQ